MLLCPKINSINKQKNTTFLESTMENLTCLLRSYTKEARASQIIYMFTTGLFIITKQEKKSKSQKFHICKQLNHSTVRIWLNYGTQENTT